MHLLDGEARLALHRVVGACSLRARSCPARSPAQSCRAARCPGPGRSPPAPRARCQVLLDRRCGEQQCARSRLVEQRVVDRLERHLPVLLRQRLVAASRSLLWSWVPLTMATTGSGVSARAGAARESTARAVVARAIRRMRKSSGTVKDGADKPQRAGRHKHDGRASPAHAFSSVGVSSRGSRMYRRPGLFMWPASCSA